MDADLALHRFDQDARGLGPGRTHDRVEIAIGHLIEAIDLRAEAFEIFRRAAGRDRGQRPAVEGAFEGDQPVPLGRAAHIVEAPGHLDRALDPFGARIAEEGAVGKARLHQPARELFLSRDAVEIGRVPQLRRLLLQGGDQVRMRMPERGDGNPGAEIQVAVALGVDQVGTFAAVERDVRPVVVRQ